MTERSLSPVYASQDRMYAECKSRGGDTTRTHKRAFCATGPHRPITSVQSTREREAERNESHLLMTACWKDEHREQFQ